MEQQALNAQAAAEIITGLEHEIGKVIVGQHLLIRRMLTALFAAIPFAVSRGRARSGCGHLLLEGVPGVAKTLTATTLAQAISAKFQRVQLTPDLLPADILGTRVYDATTSTFRIEQGPVFTNILLADEINRATPKTQSALLEAMQERQVTLADTTFPLDDPFWVLATQNPVEQEGVYTLPEAQLDRFSMMLRVGYPSQGEEVEMLQARLNQTTIERRVSPSDVNVLREFIHATVYIDDRILEYIVRLGRATRDPASVGRPHLGEMLQLGVSPRSYQHLLALSRVNAFLHGRTWALPSDVKEVFCDTTRHRIARTVRAQAENVDADAILEELLRAVPIP
ncbi:MAG TPA: AAA family ATPase [Vicinamibacterales bacterium]|nr:AAA family ATPase [Vicinamibacterales bacterium]